MKEFTCSLVIRETAEIIFNAITNPVTIELWSGYPAFMQAAADTEFSLWDGDITGRNLSVESPVKLVQEWYFEDNNPPSIVSIHLTEGKGKTRIDILHTNIPEDAYQNISEGWRKYYLGALKKYLES
jgi:activator of HSP90 ATPase